MNVITLSHGGAYQVQVPPCHCFEDPIQTKFHEVLKWGLQPIKSHISRMLWYAIVYVIGVCGNSGVYNRFQINSTPKNDIVSNQVFMRLHHAKISSYYSILSEMLCKSFNAWQMIRGSIVYKKCLRKALSLIQLKN